MILLLFLDVITFYTQQFIARTLIKPIVMLSRWGGVTRTRSPDYGLLRTFFPGFDRMMILLDIHDPVGTVVS